MDDSSPFSVRRRAFTLIELLIVVAIITILASISFKIMAGIGNKTDLSRAMWKMEQAKNALAAYYTANGFYPPGDMWDSNKVTWYATTRFPADNPLCATDGIIFDATVTNRWPSAEDHVSSMGMPYFLFTDPQAAKWAQFLAGVMVKDRIHPVTNTTFSGGVTAKVVTNLLARFIDPWEKSYHYECNKADNYQKYRLWSSGPDTKTGTPDDVYAGWQD